MTTLATYLRDGITRRIEQHRPLAEMTTFRIGGCADYFLRCETRSDVQQVAEMCRQEGMPLRVIGGGSNLLIADEGVRGMVLDISCMRQVRVYGEHVMAEGGVKLSSLVASVARAGLAGIEGLAAIPGTLGGAIAMNAGGRYGEIGDVVERVVLMTPDGELKQLSREELGFAYRESKLNGGIVLEVYLKLRRADAGRLVETVRSISEAKLSSQPYNRYSAGCTFRNPKNASGSAGKLIEMAGLKGERAGDAQISELHANFIVNLGRARANDVDKLTRLAEARVYEAFGVRLEREVKFWAA